ncbi:hypothetical protein CK516_37135, partial [Nostoc sp. 'Peltigera malacea cyanobiont' DB3992]
MINNLLNRHEKIIFLKIEKDYLILVVTISTQILPLVKEPERLENRLAEIPPEPGVYFMRDN